MRGCSSPLILVQEEGQRHAPAALAADAPVGPVGDHVAQPRAAVFRIEAGALDGFQCHLAQRLRRLVPGEHAHAFVHAHEPLRRGAVDHRALVAPAVRVAVRQRAGGHQPAGIAQRVDDLRHRLPDVQTAEQREVGRIAAVALHRVEDVLDLQAMSDAGVEVIQAVGRRRVHDAGAVVGGGVVGQIHRRQPVVTFVHMRQRVAELDAGQLLALRRRDHAALQPIAFQAFLDQRRGQQQLPALGVHQRIVERGVQVQRLVRG